MDFIDLDKACQKDSFPLPRVDLVVDGASRYQMLSFMDAFSGYNQIRMFPKDKEKTSFIGDHGTYYYKVSFGSKNVRQSTSIC